MKRKLVCLGLVLGILGIFGGGRATAADPANATLPFNMTGIWYLPEWTHPDDTIYFLLAFKKPGEEQGTISGFYRWYVVYPDANTIERWSISGWFIGNYFEITATNPDPEEDPEYWPEWVLFRGLQVDATHAEVDYVDSNGYMGEQLWERAFWQ